MTRLLLAVLILTLMTPISFADLPAIQQGEPGKNPGDIIAPRTDAQIAAWCDFTKQIIKTEFNVLCVYNGNKNH